MFDYQSSQADLLDTRICGHPARQRVGGEDRDVLVSAMKEILPHFFRIHYRLCKKGAGECLSSAMPLMLIQV
jgi:hypothetical protein